MTLDSVRCFCALVEEGSFSGAAVRVHRTQPAVSQQVGRLEEEVGTSLFDRKRGRPTRAGVALYERGRRMLQVADETLRAVREMGESEVEPIRLGTSDTVAIYSLPGVFKEFELLMPGSRVTIVNRPSSVITEQVADGLLDLGVVAMPGETPELEARALFEQRLVLGVPRGHPIAKRKRVTLAQLVEEPMLLLSDETRTGSLLRRHFLAEGFSPRAILDTASFEVVKAHVAAGNGVGFLPEETILASDREIVAVRVAGLPSVSIGVLWRRGVERARGIDLFIELLGRR